MTKKITLTKQLTRPAPSPGSPIAAAEMLALVAAQGGDPHALLRSSGLQHLAKLVLEMDGTKTTRPAATIAPIDFARLYTDCVMFLDAAAARQEGREPLARSGFHMLCHCLITCRTLEHAVARLAVFSELVGPRLATISLVVADGVVRLDMATKRSVRNACAYLSDLTGLSTYHRLFGWLIGEDIPLLGVGMRYPPLLQDGTISYLLPYPISHGAPENWLRFSADYLARPVVRSPIELERLLERFPFDLGQGQSKDAPLSERVGHSLGAMLASDSSPPTASALARQFSISVATLKRRLAAEGTSLAGLKRQTRLDLARQLLADPRLPIAEVARRTRFSDAGAFSRAFRNWTTQSPAIWRKNQQQNSALAIHRII